ncbi:non-ribosomal peptide synthetase [Dyadobacter fermentans]|uniref:non-ribosomal peptide synthetase family protein n=1 Tax=Dyadobacter fermentans TaxID=94254 RepID=UPI001CBAF1AF|nr:non-ribosomal peptide synthetase [Dyadobacter fermentans]MBZ1363087.1 amino acid adenylation domain-containing protein [Dyadobacter fermentans]
MDNKQTNSALLYGRDSTLLDLFTNSVRKHPERTAVASDGTSITFSQLDVASNKIAHCLLAAGVGRSSLIPIWLDRSVDLIVSIIGVLKAGAAYVPVDQAYPPNRLAYILSDAGGQLVITDHYHKTFLPQNSRAITLTDQEVQQQAIGPVNVAVLPEDLAYVIYTSGSTGNPKGVMVAHGSIQNLVGWHNVHFGVTAESRLSFVAGTSFDIAVWEIWSSLAAGSALYIANNEERTNADGLLDYYERHSITHGFAPTVLVPDIVLNTTARKLSLSYLFTGGEKLKPVDTKRISYNLIDYYGPTECTVFATYAKVNRPDGAYVSTIGKPLANIQAHIVNPQMQPLPAGQIGELCIGGVCLAKGYWNNPELTAGKFIDNPFRANEKLYKTGDLARWLPDGDIEFIGRIDNQVKIKGYRIELGEVETVLLKAPHVGAAAVIAKENSRQNKMLIAFIVPAPGELISDEKAAANAIRQYLKEELPGYMIPTHFAFLDKMPLNTNGKTDTRRLHEMQLRDISVDGLIAGPASKMQECIACIWGELLDRAAVDITDNFFDIGGDSLLVAVAAADISKMLKVKVYLRDIYQFPTIQALAAMLSKRKEATANIPLEDAEPVTELQNDVYLAPGTVIHGTFDRSVLKNPHHVFLTGITGFVGIHLLHELLVRTDAVIHCLIRARNTFDAWMKIDGTINKFNLTIDEGLKTRIIPVVGDLTQPEMGLPRDQYDELSGSIDIIYHSASSVNFIEPYSYNKVPNVDGLRRIIKFAGNIRLKCLALMSTISVYSWGHKFTHKTVMTEQDDIKQNILSVSKDIGYVRSKYVMEAIADLAASEGLPVVTYRLGYAICHSTTGAFAPYQWWSNLVKVCLRYSSYPDLIELREGLITVDYIAESVVHITGNPDCLGLKFNLIASPSENLTLKQFFLLLQKYYTVTLQPLPYLEWRAQWENDSTCELYPLTSLFKDNMHEGLSTVELYQNTYIWDNAQTKTFLEGSGIQEPVFDKKLLDAYLHYLDVLLEARQESESTDALLTTP